MGLNKRQRLDRLIEQVSRGERDLRSIDDVKLREAVRVALRMHSDAPDGPNEILRSRMRDRVLSKLRPRRPTLADRVTIAFELLATPAPYIARGVAALAIAGSLLAGATVVSADSVPDEPLYALKVAGEELRSALALTGTDRAAVELSMAEHRLAEAERLAGAGRPDDALVASSAYSAHLATAAAELAELEPEQTDSVALVEQLDSSLVLQVERAQTVATRLAADPRTASAGAVIAAIASASRAPGKATAAQIAETAAGVADELVKVAEDRAAASAAAPDRVNPAAAYNRVEDARPSRSSQAARKTEAPARTGAPATAERSANASGTTDSARSDGSSRGTDPANLTATTGTAGAAANDDAGQREPQTIRKSDPPSALITEKVKKAAAEAKAAAEKAKRGHKAPSRTPSSESQGRQ